jgi:hypothetical protein
MAAAGRFSPCPAARRGFPSRGRCGMAEPEFTATGVRIGHRLRSLTRAGQVLIRDGRLMLLTSYGSEIDSAPVHLVRAGKPWFAARDRALATVNGHRYLLTAGEDDPARDEQPGAPWVRRFLDAVRTAGGRAART